MKRLLFASMTFLVGVIVHPAFGQTTATTTRYILPHIAVGGGDWTTTITLVQGVQFPSPQGVIGGAWELRFWAPNGQPYRPTINGQLMTSAVVTGQITTWGRVDLELTGSPVRVDSFWCELITGYPGNVMGYATYRSSYRPGSVSTLPFTLGDDPTGHYVAPFDNTDGKVSSFAIANYNDKEVQLYVYWLDADSGYAIIPPGRLGPFIPAHGQLTIDTSDPRYALLKDRRGTLRIYGFIQPAYLGIAAWLFEYKAGAWAFSTLPTMH